MARTKAILFLLAALAVAPAYASEGCKLTLKPSTSGSFLNPTLQKVVVTLATSPSTDKPCLLIAGDELLQINDRIIPGSKAKEVMAYWTGLSKDLPRTFKVRRAGAVISVVIK